MKREGRGGDQGRGLGSTADSQYERCSRSKSTSPTKPSEISHTRQASSSSPARASAARSRTCSRCLLAASCHSRRMATPPPTKLDAGRAARRVVRSSVVAGCPDISFATRDNLATKIRDAHYAPTKPARRSLPSTFFWPFHVQCVYQPWQPSPFHTAPPLSHPTSV